MKHARFFSGAVAIALMMLSTASAQTITRSFDADAGGTLDLRLEAGGSVTITGGASNVSVEILRDGRDADDVDFRFDERRGHIVVSSEFDYQGRHDIDIEYRIRVPSSFNVDLELTGGSVSIEGVSGRFEGQTMGGSLDLQGLSGTIDMETMGGSIDLRDSDLNGKLHTMGGKITLDGVRGDVNTSTMGGDIIYRDVQPAGESEMRVKTMGGNIRVEDAPAGANVHTMGGDITVGEVGEYLQAETMGGDITAAGVDGWIEAKTMGGDVKMSMIGGTDGDRHVQISSMGGDIQLVVPDGLSMEFDVEIKIQGRRRDADDYVIESDFDLDVSAPSTRTRGMRLTATGETSGGRNLIRIRTVNGNVRILRGN
jgi:DUF4097 and DUF4098 domain-containing protein YvlB